MIHSSSETDFDPFCEESFEAVHQVEALPYSHAFEHMLYSKALQRVTSHTMAESMTFSPTLLHDTFLEDFTDIFSSPEYKIDDLLISQTEDVENQQTSFEVSFTANGLSHSLSSNGETRYCIENDYGDRKEYPLTKEAGIGLLVAFVAARQFNDEEPLSPIEFQEAQLYSPRDSSTALVEQIIMTLGNYDGDSSISTTALVETAGGVVIARLIEGEKPYMSSLRNRVELSKLEFADSESTVVYQNAVNVKAKDALENQFAERYITDVPELIDPARDYVEWAKICQEFLTAIKTDLHKYAYLDD